MSRIAINTQYVDVKSTGKFPLYNKEGFTGRFSIQSTLEKIGITENDKLLIAKPIDNHDLIFESEGIVTKVNDKKFIDTRNQKNDTRTFNDNIVEHSFNIEITKALKTNNLLSDLEYSLKSVYRFNKPIVHFQQQFRNLTNEDYDTISGGLIYYMRTTFGKLVNAIPRQNKLEFMLQAMDFFSTVNFNDITLNAGLDFLYKYIDNRILSRGKLLVATNRLLKDHLSDIIPNVEEIGFFNPTNDNPDNIISKQALLFNELFKLESQSDIRKIINNRIKEDPKLEQRFLHIFKSETWPIDLTI